MNIYLPRNLKHSRLQKKILAYLSRRPEKSVTSIAKSIGYLRESVSRSLHKLQDSGRIFKSANGYELTMWGKEEYSKVEKVELFEPVRRAKIHYWEGSVMFDCPCGITEITLSDESDDYRCECGLVYRFSSKFEVSV